MKKTFRHLPTLSIVPGFIKLPRPRDVSTQLFVADFENNICILTHISTQRGDTAMLYDGGGNVVSMLGVPPPRPVRWFASRISRILGRDLQEADVGQLEV